MSLFTTLYIHIDVIKSPVSFYQIKRSEKFLYKGAGRFSSTQRSQLEFQYLLPDSNHMHIHKSGTSHNVGVGVLGYTGHLPVLRWRELCGMRESRKNHGLVVVNNRIYAVGGQGALGTKKIDLTITPTVMKNENVM